MTLLRDGTCTLRASQGGDGTFFAAPNVDQSFSISRAAQTISFSAVTDRAFSTQSFTVAPTATSGLTVGVTSTTTDTCTVSGTSVTMVRAGTCSLTAAQPGNDTQWVAAETVTRTFTISKAAQAISFTQPGNRTYGDSAFTVTVSTDAAGLTPVVESTTTEVCTVSSTTVTILSAGPCTLRATQAGDDRYNAASSTTRTLTVSPKALTISGSFTVANKTYDRSTAATITARSLALVGTVGQDIVELEPSAVFQTRDVGEGKTVSVAASSSLSGAQAANYTLSLGGAPTTTATITPRALSIANASAVTRSYDGTDTVTIAGATLEGVITGDEVTLTNAETGPAASADVGSHGVTTSVGLAGTDAGNYTVGQPALTVTISARPVSLSGSRVYDGSTNTAAAVLSITGGLVAGEELTLSGSATTVSPDAGESLTLTPGAITLGDGDGTDGKASNYTLSGGTHRVTITQRPVRGAFTVTGRAYDGTTSVAGSLVTGGDLTAVPGVAGSGVVAVSGVVDDVQLVGGVATLASADANEASPTVVTLTGATLGGTRAGNYLLDQVADTTTTITRRPVRLAGTISVANRPYDGTNQVIPSAQSITLRAGDVISGDTVELGPVFFVADSALVGSRTATPRSSISGLSASNYVLVSNGAPSTQFTITPATLTVASGTFTAQSRPVNGTRDATITSHNLVLQGFVGNDTRRDITWTPTARFGSATAGANKTVTLVGGAVFGGARGAEYVLDVRGAPTAQASITEPVSPSTTPRPQNPGRDAALTIPTTPGGPIAGPPGSPTIPAASPSPPLPSAPLTGAVPGVTSGEARVPTGLIGGRPVTVNTNLAGSNQLNMQVGGANFGVSIPNGQGFVDSQGDTTLLAIQPGAEKRLSGAGLLPGSTVQVSIPLGLDGSREIAQLSVDANGAFDGDAVFATRPTDPPLPIGTHVLEIVSLNNDGERVVLEMAINIAQPAAAPEILRPTGELPALTPGQSLATQAGVPVTVSVTVYPSNSSTRVDGDGWTFSVDLTDGVSSVEEAPDGGALISISRGGEASVSGSGFMPQTRADVWLFSDPTLLGSVEIDGNGEFTGKVSIDGRVIPVGEHTLQIQGVGVDGFVLSANLGVVVGDPDSAPTDATTNQAAAGVLWWVVALVALLLVAGVVWWVVRRRPTEA